MEACLPALAGLTALDSSTSTLQAEQAGLLAPHLRQLRVLRCKPSSWVRACLQPLTELPRLTDLGLWTMHLGLQNHSPDVALLAESNSWTAAFARDSGPLHSARGHQRAAGASPPHPHRAAHWL